jgi:hypothetical protein
MKRILMTIAVLGAIYSGNSFAQQAEYSFEKISGIQFGITYNELQEGDLNRIIHGGNGFTGGWFLEKSNRKIVKRFELQLATELLKSSFEEEISSYHFNIPISFHYLRNVYAGIPSTGIYAGGFAKASFSIEYFDNWDENHFYWLTSYSLGPDFRIDYFFPWKHNLQIGMNMPFVALISRPPSKSMEIQSKTGFAEITKNIHENSRLAFVNRHLDIHLRARYSFKDSKKIQPKLFWQFQYVNNQMSDSGRLKMITNLLGIELCF